MQALGRWERAFYLTVRTMRLMKNILCLWWEVHPLPSCKVITPRARRWLGTHVPSGAGCRCCVLHLRGLQVVCRVRCRRQARGKAAGPAVGLAAGQERGACAAGVVVVVCVHVRCW